MRPLKLVMTGFESYKDRTEINFEDFGTRGLYLVSGDTGAGKTTIFDAISFALYGEASGENRDAKTMLRSHFADIDTPTLVELVFEVDGKKYHIERNPEYKKKTKKGNGITPQRAAAFLEFLSESRDPVTGPTNVTAEVKKILNLDKNQFSRIIMVAQGSFQKLLLAKNDEKIKLFREIFQTGKYNQLQEKLKNDASAAGKEFENCKLKLNEALARIEVNENDGNAEKIRQIKVSQYVKEEEIAILRDFVSKDEKVLDKIKGEIDDTETKLGLIELSLKDGENRFNLENDLRKVKAELELKKEEAEKAAEDFSKAEKEAKGIPELQSKKSLLEESLYLYEEIAKEEKEIRELCFQGEEDRKNLEKNKLLKEKLFSELESLKKEVVTYSAAGEKIGLYQAELEKKSSEEKDLGEINSRISKLNEYKNSLAKKKNEVLQANQEYESADKNYTEKYRLFNLEQAGILAETLKEDCACPVCGSKKHPSPACKSEKAPSQAELEEMKNLRDELNKKFSILSVEAKGLIVSVEKSEEEINRLLQKYFDNLSVSDEKLSEILSKRASELKSEVSETRENILKEENAKKRCDEINRKIPETEKTLKNLEASLFQLETKIQVDAVQCEERSKNLAGKKAGLKYETLEEARKNLDLLFSQISVLNEKLEKSRNDKDSSEKQIVELMSREEVISGQLKHIKEVNVEKLTSEKADLIQKKNLLNEHRDSLNKRKGLNQTSLERIIKLLPEITKAGEKYNMINALSEVAKGRNNQKPSLENYVQMTCLDHINHRANLRLRKMTDNKYELRRRIDENGSELGLDLNIKDFYTGRERDVNSLSGGEQFQASLALSLGLSDEIQENSGGIKLDTMFIDEGFGTLDPETLNKAMRALEDISQGNKLIGIISHVKELEERIPRKIYVKKDELGTSHVRIVNE